ncbi:MAG: hypothetical protein ACYTGP_06355 [Planctomycetota bacterium]
MAQPCVVPDAGGGTIFLPPDGCGYVSPDDFHIILDGVPPGSTIEIDASHEKFFNSTRAPGGILGGEIETFDSLLIMQIQGTGALAGLNRNIAMQVFCEVHTGPRTPGDPVQTFPNEMVILQGQLFGDPDFCVLQVEAGLNFGLPSPGQTTLTRLGPPGSDFNVDSFFDVSYRITFQGCPGSILDGLGGSTTANVPMATGEPLGCQPDPTGLGCAPSSACPDPNACIPKCAIIDATGALIVTECVCGGPNDCQLQLVPPDGDGPVGGPCVVPPGPPGTVTLPPPGCEYLSPDEVHLIIDGLPAGTTIELDPIHRDFICKQGGAGFPGCPPPGICEVPGGNLGGQVDCFSSILELDLQGTGELAGFQRLLQVPIDCQVHTGPRNPGDAVQEFPTDMFLLQGGIFGDPDFDQLVVVGGTGNGLPSPGHTTLTRLGPPGSSFVVDSFFDVSYQITFVGAPGSVLDGLAGTTTATIRMQTGGLPPCAGDCPPGTTCEQTIIVGPDGTVEVCCDCVPVPECAPDPDGTGCLPGPCSDPNHLCVPTCVVYDPATGAVTVVECDCKDPGMCRIDPGILGPPGSGDGAAGNACEVPPGPPGTVTLPPAGCEYLSPDEVHMIIDGLPPDTTIEFAPIHKDFICKTQPGAGFPDCPPPGICEDPGGELGGQLDCFQSNIEFDVQGTGDLAGFNRTLLIPVECQVHTAPRNPGDAVQEFDTQMHFLQGQLFGDPDFDSLIIRGGNGFGLPSPGGTTLTELPSGNFNVDSFFDIFYEIDFQGAPGSVLEGLGGTTQATIRMTTGLPGPACIGTCPPGQICVEERTVQADGTIMIKCNCVDDPCPWDLSGNGNVDFADILQVIANWGPCPGACPPSCFGDLSGNCAVDFADILQIIANWGPC